MLTKFLSLCLLASLSAGAIAPAADPPPPTFSDPTAITHTFVPFTPGSVKIFRGKSDGARTTALFSHLEETRVFSWNGGEVECRILEEQEFADGVLVEISTNYLAQDDDGNVHSFGEISMMYEGGLPPEAEEDSWLVGGATLPSDPPEAYNATDPTMFMPAELLPGVSFQLQPTGVSSETLTVLALDQTLKVAAGKFTGVARLQELDDGEDGGATGTKWFAPGIGLVRDKEKGSRSELIATSLP